MKIQQEFIPKYRRVKILQLFDEDYSEIFCFPYRGYEGKFNQSREIEKLKKLVKSFPKEYVKLGDLLDRENYVIDFPKKNDYIRNQSITAMEKDIKDKMDKIERTMMDNTICKIISENEHECINPTQDVLNTIERMKKDEWNTYIRDYYHRNKPKILEAQHKYYKKNYEMIKAQKKEYYQRRKEELNEKIVCECGGRYTRQNLHTHEKTTRHQRFRQNLISI